MKSALGASQRHSAIAQRTAQFIALDPVAFDFDAEQIGRHIVDDAFEFGEVVANRPIVQFGKCAGKSHSSSVHRESDSDSGLTPRYNDSVPTAVEKCVMIPTS
jgi:hypothetical protein